MTNRRWAWLLTAAAVWGCTGDPIAPHVIDPPPVVVRTDAASAAQCSNGGSVVSSGPDENGNGALDDIEVAERIVVCKPAPTTPPGVVIRLVPEPPGRNCAAGGTAVQSGPDANGNGKLDDAEVAHTEYACGELLLTRLTAEPEGANCIAGGVVFLSGRDRNADHVLDPGEVEVTEYDCGDTLSRDVKIETADDAAALANIRSIMGSLLIDFEVFDVISLPRLEHIGGALEVRTFRLNRLSLPELRDVDGPFTLSAEIASLDCPQLARVGAFSVETGGLHDLSGLPALVQVDHDVKIFETFDLVSVKLSNLSIGGELRIGDNFQLTDVTIGARDHVGFVTFSGNPALEKVDLSVAPSREAIATMDSIDVFFNPKLSHLALSADRITSLDLSDCTAIADLGFDVARFDRDVLMFDNTAPYQLALSSPRGAGQIEFGGDFEISGGLEKLVSSVPVIVDGLLVFDKTRLRSVDADARIASARGGVRFSGNTLLTDIAPFALGRELQLINNATLSDMPLLPVLDPGDFAFAVITDNPVLTSVPSLAQVERARFGIDVERNAALGQLSLPALQWLDGDLTVAQNNSLNNVAVPVLEHAAALGINSNPALQTLEAPALIDARDQLFIFSNLKLRHIVFDALTSGGLFEVDNNPKLPSCEVLGIFSHVTGFHHQSGNDDTATCGG